MGAFIFFPSSPIKTRWGLCNGKYTKLTKHFRLSKFTKDWLILWSYSENNTFSITTIVNNYFSLLTTFWILLKSKTCCVHITRFHRWNFIFITTSFSVGHRCLIFHFTSVLQHTLWLTLPIRTIQLANSKEIKGYSSVFFFFNFYDHRSFLVTWVNKSEEL